jgi:hypothetical protein
MGSSNNGSPPFLVASSEILTQFLRKRSLLPAKTVNVDAFQLWNKMLLANLLALIVAGIMTIGCSQTTKKIPSLPSRNVPVTEKLDLVEMQAVESIPEFKYRPPVAMSPEAVLLGAWNGFKRGAKTASDAVSFLLECDAECQKISRSYCASAGNNAGGIGCALLPRELGVGLVAVPIVLSAELAGAVVGSMEGLLTASSPFKVKEMEQSLRKTMGDLRIQEVFLIHLHKTAVSNTDSNFILLPPLVPNKSNASLTRDTTGALLQTEILSLGLLPEKASSEFDPPLHWFIIVKIGVHKSGTNGQPDVRLFGYLGNAHTFEEWSANRAELFRQEVMTSFTSLSSSIVANLFGPALKAQRSETRNVATDPDSK